MIFELFEQSGRHIYLSTERWTHIQKHPEISGKIEHIKQAIENPDKITTFKYDQDVRFYYKYDKIKKQYLFVSVKYLNGRGFIMTSFYTDKIK